MAIPPVGPSQIPPSGHEPENKRPEKQDLKPQEITRKPKKLEKHDLPETKPVKKGERVDFSRDARRIRRLQSDITRIQVAERVIKDIDNTVSRIVDFMSRIHEARRGPNAGKVEQMTAEVNLQVENLRKLAESLSADTGIILTGSPAKFIVHGRDVTLETPDVGKAASEVINATIKALEDKSYDPAELNVPAQLKRFLEEAGQIRNSLDSEVRETIAASVRESSEGIPEDVYSAERILRNLRNQSQVSNPNKPDNDDGIDNKTINILK